MSDDAGTLVWSWESKPFGDSAPNEDPDGDEVKVTLNLRFPGQYYDEESGLYYNYFRYYDPATGRYITSDPIGLGGGLNTYGYVESNPLIRVDRQGLLVGDPTDWAMVAETVSTATEVSIGTAVATAVGVVAAVYPRPVGEDPDIPPPPSNEECKRCPPCMPYPVGTVGYQGPEVHKTGIDAGISHYHLFVVEQIPANCKCIWKEKTRSLSRDHHYYEQPNIFYSVNLNGSGRPPNYPH